MLVHGTVSAYTKMLSIPEIASEIVNKTLANTNEENARTITLVGSKAVGKSTLLYSFLDKNDTPRETLVLEYSFGRKSNQKQAIEKIICHLWEYGGKLDEMKNVLSSIPKFGIEFFCIMIDLSKIKAIWSTLEICLQAYSESANLIILGGKYDIFSNYDSEIKKCICTTIRSVALIYNAHLLFYSSKDPHLSKRAKEMFHNIGFGNLTPFKEKNTNFTKPLMIPKGGDTWESIGVSTSTLQQVKARHLSRIPPEPSIPSEVPAAGPQRAHPEPVLDTKIAIKLNELRNLPSLEITLDDYLTQVLSALIDVNPKDIDLTGISKFHSTVMGIAMNVAHMQQVIDMQKEQSGR